MAAETLPGASVASTALGTLRFTLLILNPGLLAVGLMVFLLVDKSDGRTGILMSSRQF